MRLNQRARGRAHETPFPSCRQLPLPLGLFVCCMGMLQSNMLSLPISIPTTKMKIQSTLRADAPAFVPSWAAAVAPPPPIVIDEEYYEQRPHSPGSNGFVITDGLFQFMDIPDEELFDAKLHPLTAEELLELEQIDEVNEMLAELDIMETHQELHHTVAELRKEKRTSYEFDIDARTVINKTVKPQNRVKHSSGPKKQMHCYMKKQSFAPLQQPRSVN